MIRAVGGDLGAFIAAFEEGHESADIDQNGGVDAADLAILLQWYERILHVKSPAYLNFSHTKACYPRVSLSSIDTSSGDAYNEHEDGASL